MSRPVILYRDRVVGRAEDAREHAAIAEASLPRCTHRAYLRHYPGALVVPRYALWPWVRETLADIEELGGVPINDARASDFARDARAWAAALGDLTMPAVSWREYVDGRLGNRAVVLKAGEKSRKDRWRTHMFAPGRSRAPGVLAALLDAGADADEIVVRPYVEFEPLRGVDGVSIADPNGCPAIVEHRVFVLDGDEIARGFYWTPFEDEAVSVPDPSEVPRHVVLMAAERIEMACPSLRFYALDVAREANGDWRVVEINDGCQSGLAGCDATTIYRALATAPLHVPA